MQLESPIRKIQEECPTSTVPVTRCSSRSSKSDLELMEIKFKNISFWRTKARFLFRILLAVGFIVQSWKFVEMYMQYPSAVELEVVQPSEMDLPAFTICNVNEIRSTPYCKLYPHNCGNPDTDPEFCLHFAEYCHLVNNTKQVNKFYDISEYRHLSRYEQEILGHQYEDFVTKCTIETDDEETNCTCATLVHIYFENLEITTFTYTPRFEPIGILSFIGGYVGLWLGISLLHVYDFLETRFFRLISAAQRKCSRRKRKTRVFPKSRPISTSKRYSISPDSAYKNLFPYGMQMK
ncbi:uncharacterized protein TNIN_482621 [Trichonephila inaurata madagascariensis]|uniref:Uncharacterized protein n=1 Tax=Trichonephila inaurata madagascariensis TaxID=2747483 RepID=A0A8X7BR27_9ARAC|nr:uncharacterized protein TNIN_482621 [Trichonephila inaurata madagascariensis]